MANFHTNFNARPPHATSLTGWPVSQSEGSVSLAGKAGAGVDLPIIWGISPRLIAAFPWLILIVGVVDASALLVYTWIHIQAGTSTPLIVTDDLFIWGSEVFSIPISLYAWKKLRALKLDQTHGIPRRVLLAVLFIGIAATFDAIGQSYWVYNDALSLVPPYPSIADLFFNLNYVFFLPGIFLLVPRGGSVVGRYRILLDAGTVVFSFLALFWYFWLGPTLVGLTGPWLTKVASLSLPTFDLLTTIALTFLLFNPFGSITLTSTLTKLSIGVACLALTDFIYGLIQVQGAYYSGMLVDVGWPIAWLFIGWAVLTYPDELAMRAAQEQRPHSAHKVQRMSTTFAVALRAIIPLLFAVITCGCLLFEVALRNTFPLIQVVLVCAGLFLLPTIRQCLTLIDNMLLNERLTVALDQSQQAFVQSQDELLQTASRAERLEELRANIEHLQEVHARLSRGDLQARATVAGPLSPVAQSLNLLIERMVRWRQAAQESQRLVNEADQLRTMLDQLAEGHISPVSFAAPSNSPIGIAMMAVVRLQNRLGMLFRWQHELITLCGKRLQSLQEMVDRLQKSVQDSKSQLPEALVQIKQNLQQQQTLLQEMWKQASVYQAEKGMPGMRTSQEQPSMRSRMY